MYDPIEITKLFLFGTGDPSITDYNQHIRPLDALPASITYDMNEYMTEGGGRFAYPSLFGIIRKFFNSTVDIANGSYTYAELAGLDRLWTEEPLTDDDLITSITQYATKINSEDHAERSYIFGSTSFAINKNSLRFKITEGVKTIEFIEVFALPDNFDFQTINPLAQLINDVILTPTIDPYSLGRGEVNILFEGLGKTYLTYTKEDFQYDLTRTSEERQSTAEGIASLALNDRDYFRSIFEDPFLGYQRNFSKVIYGTTGNDYIAPPGLASPFEKYLIAGGDGNDILFGATFDDKLQGGDGNDILNGGLGNDQLDGGDGNDILNGGFGDNSFIGGKGDDTISGDSFLLGNYIGRDESFYQGSFSDYNLEFLSNGTVKITDRVADRDGSDTLSAIKFAKFIGDGVVKDLTAGQDISFVIDTTGSMGDDLDAIKAQSLSIINAIFDGSGYLNSRVSVVGYNDPYTETFLSFTDQPSIDDRKQASINAINSLYADGGGDFPESVNAGLIRALSGGAGQWRRDAVARRIILFGDAPPNDTELRAQVLSLAANISFASPIATPIAAMSISGDVATSSVADGLAVTRFSMMAAEADGSSVTYPVEIFTVLIGNDATTRDDFASLSSATGGKIFTAANASEVVQTLISVIQTPINTGNSGNDIITGNDLDNTLDGGAGNDTISGLGGNDTLIGGTGIDTIIGGTGNDTYFVDDSGDVVTEDSTVSTEIDTVKSTITYSLGANVENLILTGTAAINGTGNAGDNITTGNRANNTISGEEGNDILDGDAGIDLLVGGNGNDIYIVDTTTDNITEAANQGTDTVKSSVTFSLAALTNVENLILTGNAAINGTGNAGNNIITGNGSDNTLNGNAGNDTLNGGAGNDILDGGLGKDTMKGGTGNDSYILNDKYDAVIEEVNEGIDTVQSIFSYTLGSNLENLLLTGTANINGTGNFLDNTITGNVRNNELEGGDGNDVLNGEGGNDELTGENGNDVLNGGAGNDDLEGEKGNDILNGEAGNDDLEAGDGDDILNGGAGNDDLNGEAGNDTYVFDLNSDQGSDTIRDVCGGRDTIEFIGNEAVKIDLSLTNTQHVNRNLALKIQGIENIAGAGGNDTIYGNNLANTLKGGDGNDIINAGDGNDEIFGGLGNDRIDGGAGNDIIDAVASLSLVLPVISLGGVIGKAGEGEIDTLKGGAGKDIFVLGTASNSQAGITGSSYYIGAKNTDYAIIQDFELSKYTNHVSQHGDTIQLYGRANDYILGIAPTGSPQGIGIFTNDVQHDLIGIVQNQGLSLSSLSLTNNSQFSFVN
jgi:Ca2+-binding RTX toxin-like protein